MLESGDSRVDTLRDTPYLNKHDSTYTSKTQEYHTELYGGVSRSFTHPLLYNHALTASLSMILSVSSGVNPASQREACTLQVCRSVPRYQQGNTLMMVLPPPSQN